MIQFAEEFQKIYAQVVEILEGRKDTKRLEDE